MTDHRVFKYPLNPAGVTSLHLPHDAEVVRVGDDGSGHLHLWARHIVRDDYAETRRFVSVATGEVFTAKDPRHLGSYTLVGSMRTPHGVFVGHVFEVTE